MAKNFLLVLWRNDQMPLMVSIHVHDLGHDHTEELSEINEVEVVLRVLPCFQN